MYEDRGYCILRLSDNAFIPKAEGNRDYQQFKAWCAEGNEPDIYRPPEPSLEKVKDTKLKEINTWADAQLKPILDLYPEEVKSWPEQKTEAEKWLADNTAETSLIMPLPNAVTWKRQSWSVA